MDKFIKQAFTLIELLVVIAIIGILSGLIVVSMGGMTTKATIAKAQVFSNSLRNSLMLNLISEWRFDGNTNDSWSNGNNGIWYGSAGGANTSANYRPSSECISGQCLNFDGTDDYVEMPDSNSLNIVNEITIGVWVKHGQNGVYDGILQKGSFSNNYGSYEMHLADNNQIKFVLNNGAIVAVSSGTVLQSDGWCYLVGTYDKQYLKIYKNGVLDGSPLAYTSNISIDANPLRIGEYYSSLFLFTGLIDDIRIYNTAMSISQIKESYYAGLNSLLSNGNINTLEYKERLNNLLASK
jgi:prepilin-type N-terminal cleavage/methylation domain-containing protein